MVYNNKKKKSARVTYLEICVFEDNINELSVIKEFITEYCEERQCCNLRCFNNATDFKEYYNTTKTDIAFLDISIEEDSKFGIKCAKEIRMLYNDTHIIFTTALAEYMPLSFEDMIRPTQFLIKPVTKESIFKILKNIYSFEQSNALVIKNGSNIHNIKYNDIVYIEQNKNKMTIHTNAEDISAYVSLKSVAQKLNNSFCTVQKGVVVNIDFIEKVDFNNKKITMKNGEIVNV